MNPPIQQPTKQQVREFGRKRQASHEPPPSPERIREMLGWWLKPKG